MAKLSVSRLLEASKLLQTAAGQQLQELITFVNDVTDQVIRALRQGLTFQDNFKCKISVVSLTNGVEQRVNYDQNEQIFGILPVRSISASTAVAGFVWYLDQSNQLVVNAQFVGAPTTPINVTILIFYL